jgi:ribosomal protein S18 acetylase RimI-like enzyme
MPALIREALISDAESVARIHIDSWRHTYSGIMPQGLLESLSLAKRTEEWMERLNTSSRRNFVLEDNGVVCGWVSVGPARDTDLENDFGELYGIYVAPSHLGRSFGRQLCARAEAELSSEGKIYVCLWVLEKNMNARRFYERRGFRQDGATKSINLGGADLPELRYVKNLRTPNQSSNPTLTSVTPPAGQEARLR